jgi:hypothetical protein
VKRTARRDFCQRHSIRPYRPTYHYLRGAPQKQQAAQEELEALKNRFVAPARHLWVEKLPPVGSRRSYGRSDRLRIGGSAPVKKPGPGPFADVRVVTP